METVHSKSNEAENTCWQLLIHVTAAIPQRVHLTGHIIDCMMIRIFSGETPQFHKRCNICYWLLTISSLNRFTSALSWLILWFRNEFDAVRIPIASACFLVCSSQYLIWLSFSFTWSCSWLFSSSLADVLCKCLAYKHPRDYGKNLWVHHGTSSWMPLRPDRKPPWLHYYYIIDFINNTDQYVL